jgi:hypothetical protein
VRSVRSQKVPDLVLVSPIDRVDFRTEIRSDWSRRVLGYGCTAMGNWFDGGMGGGKTMGGTG